MSYCFSLRLTPSAIDPSANPNEFKHLLRELIFHYKLTDYATCFEKFNKYGEPTAPHFHFNFLADAKKEAIAQKIRRWENYKIKGNKMYCLQRHADPDDFNRWFRYIFKENYLKSLTKGFSDEDIEKMQLLAKDERKRSVEKNCQHREKLRETSTLFDRFAKKVDIYFKDGATINYKQVWIKLLELYIEDKRTVSPKTIQGYTYLYLLTRKHISNLEFYNCHN